MSESNAPPRDEPKGVLDRLTDTTQAAVTIEPPTPAQKAAKSGKPRGRPKTILIPRRKVSFWVSRSKWNELKRQVQEEQATREVAGRSDASAVTLTWLIDQMIDEGIAKRRQAERRRAQRQAKAKRRRQGRKHGH